MSNYNPNDLFANRYLLQEKIGIGGFSEVWKAVDQMAEDTEMAIKIYAPERGMDEHGLKQFRREYAVVLNLNHAGLLTARHFDVFNGSPYLVMPFIDGGSVYSKLIDKGNFEEKDIAVLIVQMAGALEFLHENDVLHQDIKPDNILIDRRGNYLLTDFGISSRLRSSLRKSTTTAKAMTVAYAPPERFSGRQEAGAAGDIFSFGVLLYELAIGDVPWMGAGGVVIKPDSEPIELSDDYSNRFQSLVQACLRYNPEDRPTAGMLKTWANAYLQNGAWPEIPKAPAASKEPLRGRSTQRMDTPPAEEPVNEQETPVADAKPYSGKEAATMKHLPDGFNPNAGKSKKPLRIAAILGGILIVATAASYFSGVPDIWGKGSSALTADEQKTQEFNALKTSADSAFGASNYQLAESLYASALMLFPDDTSALNGRNRSSDALGIAGGDSSGMDSTTAMVSTNTETPTVENPVVKKKTEPVIVDEPVRKPTEEELRNERLKGLGDPNAKWYYTAGLKFKYSGDLQNGKPHGYGTATFDDGDKYVGNWVDGDRSGQGTHYFNDGTTYIGQWRDSKCHGRGKMTWENGDVYDGGYAYGERSGMGTYKAGSGNTLSNCPDCVKYEGYWKNNTKEGTGKCYDKNGELLYRGEFRSGKPVDDYPNQ